MKRRKRVDWEKEMQKTEVIRMRGLRTSLLGFAVAVLFILGAYRMNTNEEASLFPYVTMIGCFLAATIVLVFTLRRRAKKLKKTRDEENEESE